MATQYYNSLPYANGYHSIENVSTGAVHQQYSQPAIPPRRLNNQPQNQYSNFYDNNQGFQRVNSTSNFPVRQQRNGMQEPPSYMTEPQQSRVQASANVNYQMPCVGRQQQQTYGQTCQPTRALHPNGTCSVCGVCGAR